MSKGPDHVITHQLIRSLGYSSRDLKTNVSFWILLFVSLNYMFCFIDSSVHPWQTPEGLRVTVTLLARINDFIDKFWFFDIRHFSFKRLTASCGHI